MLGTSELLTTRSRFAAAPTSLGESFGMSIGMDPWLSFGPRLKPHPQEFRGMQGALSSSMRGSPIGNTHCQAVCNVGFRVCSFERSFEGFAAIVRSIGSGRGNRGQDDFLQLGQEAQEGMRESSDSSELSDSSKSSALSPLSGSSALSASALFLQARLGGL